jgi:oligogalacturonide transporter
MTNISKVTESEINPDKLSLKEKIFFGMGDFYNGNIGLFISIIYFKFLTDVMLIPAGIAGTIVLVTKIWDAVIDPCIGVISDNTRTRWGRRRPAIFIGGILTVLSMGLLFIPLDGFELTARVIYITISWMFFCTVSSFIGISYSALSGEISNDYRERNTANTIRLAVSLISTLLVATTPLMLRDALLPVVGEGMAHLYMALIFSVIFGVSLVLVAIYTKERVPMPEEKVKFSWKTFIQPLKIKCFRQILIFYTFAFLCLDIVTTLFQHFMQYVAHRESETSFVLAALVIAQIITIPFVYKLTKRFSKPFIFRLFAPIWLLGAVCLSFYSANWDPWVIYAFSALTGVGVCGCVMMPWLMFPDAVDVGEFALGSRDTGTFSGVMVFLRQLSAAVGVALIGWIMEWTGYDVTLGTFGQPESAITGFRGIIVVAAIIFLGLAFIFAFRSKMNEANASKIKQVIALKRENAPVPEDLQREADALRPDLVGW